MIWMSGSAATAERTSVGPDGSEWFYAGGEIISSPKPIRLKGDPRPGIVFGTTLGEVWVLTADGVPAPGWPVTTGQLVGNNSAAIADLDGDGSQDVVVHSDRTLEVYSQGGGMLPGWPQLLHASVGGSSLVASPVVFDIDHDGDVEILVGHGTYMFAFHHNGRDVAGWPIGPWPHPGPMFSTPAVGDVDGDGKAEICFQIWSTPAELHLVQHDGTAVVGWPKVVGDGPSSASPILADLDGNGALDVVVSLVGPGDATRVHAFRVGGSELPGFPVTGPPLATPMNNALGDVDGDGYLELFVSARGYREPLYSIQAWNHDGTRLSGRWPQRTPMCASDSSPILADVDGGSNEIILGLGGCYVGQGGILNIWAADGSRLPSWPRYVSGELRSSPLVIDSDKDGVPEIYVGSSDGWIHRFLTEDATGGSNAEWNQIFHDARNTNRYPRRK